MQFICEESGARSENRKAGTEFVRGEINGGEMSNSLAMLMVNFVKW